VAAGTEDTLLWKSAARQLTGGLVHARRLAMLNETSSRLEEKVARLERTEERLSRLERMFNTEEMKRAPHRVREAFGAGIGSPRGQAFGADIVSPWGEAVVESDTRYGVWEDDPRKGGLSYTAAARGATHAPTRAMLALNQHAKPGLQQVDRRSLSPRLTATLNGALHRNYYKPRETFGAKRRSSGRGLWQEAGRL